MSAASPDDDRAPARIAIVRMSHLGDVVLALPLFHALRERFPRAEIAWVVQDEFASLLEGLPGLARVIRFARRGGARAWLELRDELARFAPELAIDAQGNLKSAFATLASAAPRRVGLARQDWREPLGASVLTERAPAVEAGLEHAMHRTLALCAHLRAAARVRTDPALSGSELALGREQLARLAADAQRAVIVHVAEPSDVRSWSLAHFEQLARLLAREGRFVILFAGPREEAAARELAARLAGEPRVAPWIGRRNLRELAALFTAAGESGATFVGCDSGPMHLAAACGMRVVVLAGPTKHERTGPWPTAKLLGAADASSVHTAVRSSDPPSCAPCLRRECTHPRGPVCMSTIDAATVAAAVAQNISVG